MAWNFTPHKGAIPYAATSFATGLMSPVVRMFYVKIFLDRYRISSHWFHIVQVIYMVWNAINDPLFGYFQDNCNSALVKSRRYAMLYGAPFFALSFVVFWFPWRQYEDSDWLCGVHLLFSLCFYDSLFTYVLLAHGCILAEMTNKHSDRIIMLQYANIAHLLGSLSVFLCDTTSYHLQNYGNFQITTVILAFFAWVALTYTGRNAHTLYDLKNKEDVSQNSGKEDVNERSTDHGIFKLTWQILSNKNFTWFVIMNFMSEVHGSFAFGFCIIIVDTVVLKEMMPGLWWSVYYGSITLLPKILQTVYRPILVQVGYYKIHNYIFLFKAVGGVLMYIIGREYQLIFLFFIISDCTMTSMISSMQGLVMTDIIDNDMHKYNRSHPMSSMVFGTNALIVKPPQSLAPIATVALLNFYGYEAYKNNNLPDTDELQDFMFTLACVVPVVMGTIQYAAWNRYKIQNSHLTILRYVES